MKLVIARLPKQLVYVGPANHRDRAVADAECP
jgi:hypothetical protein